MSTIPSISANNRKLSLYLYRSLVRKCNHFDRNPKLKAYFVTPNSLRYQLPTFFLPSVSFAHNLKVLFRLYATYQYPSQTDVNTCISDGFYVLKNLNLGQSYHKKFIEKEISKEEFDVSSIIKHLEKEVNPSQAKDEVKDAALEKEDGKSKTTNFWAIDSSKEVKPGTLLISHPSLGSSFNRSVVLITHTMNDKHYGVIINQPIPTSPIIRHLQEQFETAPQLENHSYSKNLLKHFRFSLKRPLSPFTKTPWFCGGPCAIESYESMVPGIKGLPQAQVLHPFSDLQGATMVRDGIYLGGDFKEIGDKIKQKEMAPESVMMMMGCSVWRPGQLRKEIDEGAWFTADCTNQQILKMGKDEKFWIDALKSMGGDYRDLVNLK
eukprot:gene7550-8832_t